MEELGLVVRVPLDGRRLALSNRALALLARRDRASVALARKRWSVEAAVRTANDDWRAIPGTRSRQLARHINHTAVQIDPPHRATRYFRSGRPLRSVHPDAFGVLRRGEDVWPLFLEWERRALHPSTMAARLAPYLRYYAPDRPVADHGAVPAVLVVFEDAVAPAHFLRVAHEEIAWSGVDVPLWTASRDDLDLAGPLGAVRRIPGAQESAPPFR